MKLAAQIRAIMKESSRFYLYYGRFIILLLGHLVIVDCDSHGNRTPITYERSQLLQLRDHTDIGNLVIDMPPNLDQDTSLKRRKRGKRGGLRRKVRDRNSRTPLPTLVLSNLRSLRKQLTDLEASVKFMFEFRESCLLCFTETWLNESINNDQLALSGFGTPIRLDRDLVTTGKSTGGGVCVYINERWCKHYVLRVTMCTQDIEILTLSVRPFYLPREFGQIVYVPPQENTSIASNYIRSVYGKVQSQSPGSPHFILDDFNKCTLKAVLLNLYQYVDCSTRFNKTIDLCYGNVKNAFKSYVKPLPVDASVCRC